MDGGGRTWMGYRYELHCHTIDGSKCGTMGTTELVEFYHDMGYAGFCITDHFSGNSTVPDDAPWAERVLFYDDIYGKLCDAGNKLGMSVFFGVEMTIYHDINSMSAATGNDFLLYNLSKDWLLSNRDAFTGRPSDIFAAIRGAGGFIIHAHPFKEADYIDCIRLYPRSVDAVETFNANSKDFANGFAKTYAQAYGLPETSGSDFHRRTQKILTGMETLTPCLSAGDLIEAIKNGRAIPFVINKD